MGGDTLNIDGKEDFLKIYGDEKVTFSSYYKYTFTYRGETDLGVTLIVSTGGSSEDIYKMNVANNDVTTIRDLDPYMGYARVGDTQQMSFYD